MWAAHYRGTHHASRWWLLVAHLQLGAAALAGLAAGAVHARSARRAAILGVVALATVVNAFFVAEARRNLRRLPALVAGSAAGYALLLRGRPRTGELPA